MAGAQNTGQSVRERREQKERERKRKEEEQKRKDEEQERRQDVTGTANPEVPIAELAFNPRNARESLEGLEGLASTYASTGLLQPVVAIPADTFRAAFPEVADDVPELARLVVIGGNRRLAAAQFADMATVPVVVNNRVTTRKDIVVAAAVENLAREELKPLEELATIEDLKNELGTYGAVAKQLGKTPGWVSQRRRLHNLQPEVREALVNRADGMTIELARDLGKIKGREKQLQAWKAEQELAKARADKPTPKKTAAVPSQSTGTPNGKEEEQGGTEDQDGQEHGDAQDSQKHGQDPEEQTTEERNADVATRRDACALAVASAEEDPTLLSLIALRLQADVDEAAQLAAEWLTAAGANPAAINPPAGDASSDATHHQATLALALAHCELHATQHDADVYTHVYLNWLSGAQDRTPEPAA